LIAESEAFAALKITSSAGWKASTIATALLATNCKQNPLEPVAESVRLHSRHQYTGR